MLWLKGIRCTAEIEYSSGWRAVRKGEGGPTEVTRRIDRDVSATKDSAGWIMEGI